jgi:putative iron-regulated protein
MRLARLAVALALGAFASSLAASAPEAAASEQVTTALREHAQLALGSYREAVAGLHELQAAVRELLAQPSKPSLEAARRAWIACRDAYGRTEALRFSHGPIDDLHPITGVQGPRAASTPGPSMRRTSTTSPVNPPLD